MPSAQRTADLRGHAPVATPSDALELAQREAYRRVYARQARPERVPADYFTRLVELRVELVRRNARGGRVLDLCCGEGEYLARVGEFCPELIGIDFTPELLERARDGLGRGRCRLGLADARALPLADACVDLVYVFSALYTIPRWEDVVAECARVLAPGGAAILDCGVRPSLNLLVSRAMGGVALPRLPTLRALRASVRAAGLRIECERAFQLLPLWGARPRWLRPLLRPAWRRLLAARVGDRLLDEWLSGLPGLRHLAFRHLLVCRREPAP